MTLVAVWVVLLLLLMLEFVSACILTFLAYWLDQLKDELCKENLQLAGELLNFFYLIYFAIRWLAYSWKCSRASQTIVFTTEENLQKEPRIMELRNQVRLQSFDSYDFFFLIYCWLLKFSPSLYGNRVE